MGFFKRLFAIFRKKEEVLPTKEVEEKNCPFCWGYQEYDQKTRIMKVDKQIDVKNHRDVRVKVGKFMFEHVDGFKNKKRIVERCPDCGGKRIRYVENP